MMKKLLNCLVVLFILAGLSESLSAQPQYYNYNTGGSNNSFPFNVVAGKQVQLLYLAGDFNQPSPAPSGVITSVFFRVSPSYPLGPWTYANFTIKMGQSTITTFASGGYYTGPLDTVYYRASVQLSAAAGTWLEIVLDTPFPYDPLLSLIVDVGQCGVPGATGYSAVYTALTGNRRNWSVGGCPFVYYGPNSAVYHLGLNIGPASPTVVTGGATGVTGTTATLNGTIDANGISTAVTFEYGLTTGYGTTVPGVPSPVTGNTPTPVSAAITGLTPATLYHFRVNGTTATETINGADSTFTTPAILPNVITTAATLVTSTSATLNGTVNAGGASTAVFFEYGLTTSYGTSVPGVPSPVTGNTTTPVSAAISGLTTNTTYHFRVNGTNSVGTTNGNDMTFFTTTCPMPGAPGPISGDNTVCGNSTGNVYSVAPIVNATSYVWTVPPGGVITAGANTNSITVTMGNTPGNVTVYGVDSCGNGPTSSLSISITPAPVPTVSGMDTMCVNSGYFEYTTETGMTGYVWTTSAGGTIIYGQGTYLVLVEWTGSGAQSVNVNYIGPTGCPAGSPTVLPVFVKPLPGAAGTITGTGTLCGGTMGVAYSVPPITDAATYVWTLPAGATIASGELTNAITVDFEPDASSGNITVYGNNLCGNGTVSPGFPVTVNPIPPTPVIVQSRDTLISDAPDGNQWYIDGVPIPGATGQTYVATWDGEYWCVVTLNGCSSAESNHIVVTITGIHPLQPASFTIRPIPNDGRFTLTITSSLQETFTVQVFNSLGVMIREFEAAGVKGTIERIIDLRPVANGIYTVVIQNSDARIVKKILVSK